MNAFALIKKTTQSLTGHILLFQALWAVPMAILFIWLNYTEGALTVSWALWCVFVSMVGALAIAPLMWFTCTRPMIRRIAKRRSRAASDSEATR